MIKLEKLDFSKYGRKEIIDIISQLSSVDEISNEIFILKAIHRLDNKIITIMATNEKKLVGIASIFFEPKQHKLSSVAHIEDVVVDKEYRGQDIGKRMIEKLVDIAQEANCYKVILSCSKANVGFYEKCGFYPHEISMRLDIE